MAKRSFGNGQTNRREFVATAAALGASTALLRNVSEAIMQPRVAAGGVGASRTGISNTAYQKAWKRAATLVSKMTLVEKIAQTGGHHALGPGVPANKWVSVSAIKRLGLRAYNYYSGEALHGLQRPAPVTSFPLPLGMVCSWNPELALRVYTAVSDEARAYNKKDNVGLSYFSPQTLNLHRDPRWGRCEEAPGEDPCLAGTWAVNVVRGMQGDDPNYLKTTACAKHFICNNTDDDRYSVSASVNPRNFWEYYTRAYQACARQGDVVTFMVAYNAINGVPCAADRFLLTSLLRERWGFRGYVVSDCDAVACIYSTHHYVATVPQAAALAMQAGCELNCGNTLTKYLGRAVNLELVSEADISRAVTRLLTVRFLLGEFDPPEQVPYNRIGFDVVNSPAHQALALEAARQSMVLLKNENSFLPLDKSSLRKVAVIGPLAGFHLGGYSGSPSIQISPLDGIATALGVYDTDQYVWPDQLAQTSAGVQTQSSSEGGTNIGWIGNGSWIEYRPQDLTGKTHIVARVASIISGALIHAHIDSLDGPIIATLRVPDTGGWQKWTGVSAPIGTVRGKHKLFFTFSGKGSAICNMEWFQLQPVKPTSARPSRAGRPVVTFAQGCSIEGPKDERMFSEAVDAAEHADMVILVCGVNQSVDAEVHDRKNTNLPGVQHELVQACFKANPKTVLVLNTNNTVAVNWEQKNLPAIVAAIFAGQAQGTAIADVLFGNYNPGGKTCCTWYKSVDQLPPFHNYDIMKGRTYMYFEGDPLYPFGYGLSYTRFKFSDLTIAKATLAVGESIMISARITNIGLYSGAEVAQFYVTAPKSPVKRPIKELVGFQRVELKPGESRRVTFTLPYNAQALWYWHESQRKFVLQPGTLKLMIGSSSADIHLTVDVDLQACTDDTLGGPETLNNIAVKSVIFK
ncbi:MAG: glycoside hydrolase family 3 C-terminal domain-containing protein [Phycisphaerae bacterium]